MLNLTSIFRKYAQFRSAKISAADFSQLQAEQLLKLVKKAENTKFGLDHSFNRISSVADFQRQVPLRKYENFWEEYWQASFPKIQNITWPSVTNFFSVTSGTTSGKTKYIPYTPEMAKSNSKAGLDLLCWHVCNRPKSKLLSGKSFMLGGSSDLVEEAPGIFSGDLSGISVKTLPSWARPFYFPPSNLALIKDWEEKIDRLATQSLLEKITLIGGVPSWLLILFQEVRKKSSKLDAKISEIFSDLEVLVHGGVNFAPYYERFSDLIDLQKVELREVYPASEGFIATADRGYGEGLLLNMDHGIFYEFIPLEELNNPKPTRHWVDNIELNVNYAIALTTCAGLYSYIIGDTVRFVDRKPPRLLVTGRTSYSLSAFGEHLIAEELENAVGASAKELKIQVSDYSVGALFPKNESELGRHIYVIEFENYISEQELKSFGQNIDQLLININDDYAAHRADGFGMASPEIKQVKTGFFKAWMRSRGKLGGQHKVPRIINDESLLNNLLNFSF